MSENGDGFLEHRRAILGAIDSLNRALGELTTEHRKSSVVTETTLARLTTKIEALNEKSLDVEKRLRDVETLRSQALLIGGLSSILFSGLIALLMRILVR